MKKFWRKSESPGIKLIRSEVEVLQNQVVELGRLRDIRDNLQNELWPPAIWKLASLADTFVLGRRGIYPRFTDPEADKQWKLYRVDSRARLSVRALLRIILTGLVVNNEAFLRIDYGTLTPMPQPMRIVYADNNTIPVRYQWGAPHPISLPPEEVWHIMVEWYPGQKRGESLLWTMWDLLNDRRNYIKSVVKMAKNAARMSLFHKRNRGNPLLDADSDADDVKPKTQEFSFDEDTMLQIGPNDEISSISAGSAPVPPSEIDRLVMGTVGQRAGISRMSVQGDFSDATYSSARFADLNDHGVWARYQDLLLEVVEYLYEQWPARPLYDLSFREMFIPPFPYIDPGRVASVNETLINMGAKSVQEVISEDGRDPETVFTLIEEYRRRFGDDKKSEESKESDNLSVPEVFRGIGIRPNGQN